jgi:hypothetical protein
MLGQKNPPQDQAIGDDAAGKGPGKYFETNAVGQCTGGGPPPEALSLGMELTFLFVATSGGKPIYAKGKQGDKAESTATNPPTRGSDIRVRPKSASEQIWQTKAIRE